MWTPAHAPTGRSSIAFSTQNATESQPFGGNARGQAQNVNRKEQAGSGVFPTWGTGAGDPPAGSVGPDLLACSGPPYDGPRGQVSSKPRAPKRGHISHA